MVQTADLGGDLRRLGGEDGDAALRLGGVSPRRRIGELGLRRGGESGNLLGDAPLLGRGDRLLGESTGFRCGEANHILMRIIDTIKTYVTAITKI